MTQPPAPHRHVFRVVHGTSSGCNRVGTSSGWFMERHQQHRAGGMAAQCRPHSYGRTCCCTRGHTSPDNGKRHTFHRCHPRQHITTRTPPPPGARHQVLTSPTATPSQDPDITTTRTRPAVLQNTPTFHGRYGHNVRGPHCRPHGQKKPPHGLFSCGGLLSIQLLFS